MTPPYAELVDGITEMFPRDRTEYIANALADGFTHIGITVFNARNYFFVDDHDLRAAGGRVVTYDGHHPSPPVTMTILREIASAWCARLHGDDDTGDSVALSASSVDVDLAVVTPHRFTSGSRFIENVDFLFFFVVCFWSVRRCVVRRHSLSSILKFLTR